jgi:beta-carotene 3-hydroxylase
MTTPVIVTVAFVLMEGFTYLAHRFVMHGVGRALHRSHHAFARNTALFEANDLFPVSFAAFTILAMTAGVTLPSLHVLLTVGIGVTLYGASYAFVHDVYIHGRLGRLPRIALLEYLKSSHRIHHLYGAEPYGMLLPVVPRTLRARAATETSDPFMTRKRELEAIGGA